MVTAVTADGDDPTEITSGTTITEPGIYTLPDDISATAFNCIRIESDDVVVDGQGNTLTLAPTARERFARMTIPSRGTKKYGTGVGTEEPVRNVTVRDLTVSKWDTGVRLANATDSSVVNVTASDNVDGVALEESRASVVTESAATNNEGEGIVFRSTTESTVAESSGEANGRAGIALVESTDNTVSDVTSSRNRGDGVVLEESDRNDLSTIRSTEDMTGVTLVDARENRLADVSVDRSDFAGIALGYASENELAELTVSNTSGDNPIEDEPSAIWLFASSANHFADVTVEDNEVWTIYALEGSVENRFEEVTVDDGEPVSITVTDDIIGPHGNESAENDPA